MDYNSLSKSLICSKLQHFGRIWESLYRFFWTLRQHFLNDVCLKLEFDIIFWKRASFINNLLVPERYFLIEWVTFLFPVVKIEQKCLALFVFEKTQWSSSELSIFYKPEGSRGKRQRRTLSSEVGSAKIRGADVKTRPGQGLQPQRLHTRFLDTWPEEFSASSKVAF